MDFKELIKNAADKTTEIAKAELEKAQEKRELIAEQKTQTHVDMTITNGGNQIQCAGNTSMYQRSDGSIYFNQNVNDNFTLLEYLWNGPKYQHITDTVSNTSGTEKTKGKSGKMAAGAVIGTMLFPGVGTAVGAAIGAGGKKKKQSSSSTVSSSTSQTIEELTPATIKLKNNNTGDYISLVIACNTIIDSQIKCFRFFPESTTHSASANTVDALKGIKALKELLDMGAITQDEFEQKKKQLLDS